MISKFGIITLSILVFIGTYAQTNQLKHAILAFFGFIFLTIIVNIAEKDLNKNDENKSSNGQ